MNGVERQGSAPIGRLLLQYSLPAVAGFLTNALYQLVDRILVGRGVGTEGMAAVTCAYPLTILSMGIGLLLGTGTGNHISTYLGQGRPDRAERVLGQSVRLGLFLGGAVALVYTMLARPILRLCGAEGPVLDMAVPYLRVSAIGQVFLICIISMGNILRVQGRPGLGLAFMAGGNVLNAILAAWAIFGLRLGVVGAAAATTISVGVNLALLVAFVQGPRSILHIRRTNLGKDAPLARSILGLGAPILLMQVLGMLVFLAANQGALALDGPRGVAAVGVFNAVTMLLLYPQVGVAQAMQPLVAYNRGAGRSDRVRALLGRVLIITTAMGCVFGAAVALLPEPVAALFTRTDARLVEIVRKGLPWFMISVALFGLSGTASHFFLAIHKPRQAGLLLLGRQLLAMPLFVFLPRLFGFPGLYLVAVLSDLPFAVVSAALLRVEWRRLSSPAPLASAPSLPALADTAAGG
ncbi:MAG TPA: MATE family efflux transporter [Anaeromyxobacter sp.]|nr:MATE family efflux transporter [Anaeromyxobacter sp.]